jgi:hypothetical protein
MSTINLTEQNYASTIEENPIHSVWLQLGTCKELVEQTPLPSPAVVHGHTRQRCSPRP